MTARLLFFAHLLLFSFAAKWFDEVPSEAWIPSNIISGDEILTDRVFRIRKEANEDVTVSLSPPSDSVAVVPAVVAPGGTFKIIVNDPDALQAEYKVQALGVYSGDLEERPLSVKFESKREDPTRIQFAKDVNELHMTAPLEVSEIAVVTTTSPAPSSTRFALTGPFSEQFVAHSDGTSVIVSSIPCENCPALPREFSMILSSLTSPPASTTLHFVIESAIHPLRFSHSYETSIVEGSSEFTKLVKLRAGGKHAIYSLEDSSGLFAVHPRTGLLSISHPEFLFIDTIGEKVNLTAIASEGSRRVRTHILVHIVSKDSSDEEELAFAQDQYSFKVSSPDRFVGKVDLKSSNDKAEFGISEGPSELFEVKNGNLLFIGDPVKETREFSLMIIATSSQSVATTKADVTVIGLGSNPLRRISAENVHIEVPNEANTGTVLTKFEVEDRDESSGIEFSIERVEIQAINGMDITNADKSIFGLNPSGRSSELVLQKPISNLKWSTARITVTAFDSSNPREPKVQFNVYVTVLRTQSEKDPEPDLSFLPLPNTITIPSSLPVNSVIYQLRSTLLENITFSLDSGSGQYAVEPNGDILTISALTPTSKETLALSASGELSVAHATIVVEVAEKEERAPLLAPIGEVFVKTSTPVETVIANITFIQGSGNLSLDGGNNLFALNEDGVLRVSSPLSAPSEELLLVNAISESGADSEQIIVHIEDANAKRLSFPEKEYEISVMENLPLNSFVADVRISSKFPVHYTISPIGNRQLLDIDHEGRITLKEELPGADVFSFVLNATSNEETAFVPLTLNVKTAFTCQPEFLPSMNNAFYIEENADEDAEIGRVKAKELDPKCDLRYYFYKSEARDITSDLPFAHIDPITGVITARRSFDFERHRSYPMVLELRAGMRLVAQLASELLIRDVDDHPVEIVPIAQAVEISESSPVGSVVATVRAHDHDASQKIFYRLVNDSSVFEIEQETGVIRLKEQLDRETKDYYRTVVEASNNEIFENSDAEAVLEVYVKDVNDNGPIFPRSNYEVAIDKNSLLGSEVVRLTAIDPDIDEGERTILYSITESVFNYHGTRKSLSGYFAIDQLTGVIRVLEHIKEFVGGIFELHVEASDGPDASAQKGSTLVKIMIHDPSDIIRVEFDKGLRDLTASDISKLSTTIYDATGLTVTPKSTRYHAEEKMVLERRSDLDMIITNTNTSQIITSERALAILRNQKALQNTVFSSVTVAESPSPLLASSITPILLVGLIFVVAMMLACLVFALLICSYRARYHRARKFHDDDRVIASTIQRVPQRRIPTPPAPALEETPGYAIQERRLSAVADVGESSRYRS